MTTQLGQQPLKARPTRFRRATVLAAFLWSLLALPFGLWQLLDPDNGPYSSHLYEPTFQLPASVPDWIAPAALIAAGLGGLLIARAKPRLWPLTALYAVVFGMLLTTTTPMSLAGYFCAFLIPIAVVVTPVLVARGTTARVVAAAAVAAVLIALTVAGVDLFGMYGGFLKNIAAVIAAMWGYFAVQVWTVAGGAIWTAMTLQHLLARRDGVERAWLAPHRAAKWGRVAAWIAFACALPYGFLRMTWLTPWTLFAGPAGEDFDPATRVWGILLGFACLGGGILCLGLTQRWGTRWPFWMFAFKGRPVPPLVAIIPASIVAALFTFASLPFLALGLRHGETVMAWAFPFYIWGPALGAATLAYAIRRGVVKPSDI
jgi:hypothetical protein